MKSRDELSAGGVVYRKNDDHIEVLICKDRLSQKWVLPKGRVEQAETLAQTAQREVQEEAAVIASVIASLGEPERYIYTAHGTQVLKSVHYFLLKYESDSNSGYDANMEEVRWVSLDQAVELMGYESAKEVLTRAKVMLTSQS